MSSSLRASKAGGGGGSHHVLHTCIHVGLRYLRYLILASTVLSVVYAVTKLPSRYARCEFEYKAALEFIEHNCATDEEMRRLGTWQDCALRYETRDEAAPMQCAWLHLMEDLGGCGKSGCLAMWRQTASSFTSMFAAFVFAMLAVAWVLKRGENAVGATIEELSSLPRHKCS